MKQPIPGIAFTWSDEGDMRADVEARERMGTQLGLDSGWATVDQIHGGSVRAVSSPGTQGVGDAVVTSTRGLPLAIFTADCLGVVLAAPGVVGVAHAGWRGLAAGILENTVSGMRSLGSEPEVAYLGPSIGACCYEVGDDVAEVFEDDVATTTWGTQSVDLVAAARRRLEIEVIADGRCTHCGGGFSHRRDGTPFRMATLGWLP